MASIMSVRGYWSGPLMDQHGRTIPVVRVCCVIVRTLPGSFCHCAILDNIRNSLKVIIRSHGQQIVMVGTANP